MTVDIHSPSLLTEPYSQKEMGVLIGIHGDMKGRVIIDSQISTFSAIGMQMFGMPLEGTMLESFAGEFGNMFAGKLCTLLGEQSLDLDITTPTVMVGKTELYGFNKAFKLPTSIVDIGELNIIYTIDDV